MFIALFSFLTRVSITTFILIIFILFIIYFLLFKLTYNFSLLLNFSNIFSNLKSMTSILFWELPPFQVFLSKSEAIFNGRLLNFFKPILKSQLNFGDADPNFLETF